MTDRLLLLSPFFHPEPISTGKYNTFLAKVLVRKGICTDVICFHPLYPGWHPCRTKDGLPGVCIYRGGIRARYPNGAALRRAALEFGFILHILRHSGRIKRYSHIVAVLPPMLFLPLVRLFAGRHARVIAIVHDLQGVMAGIGAGKERQNVVRMVRFLEGVVLKCSHRIIALSNAMATFLSESYEIPSSKIKVCWPFVSMDSQQTRRRLSHLFARDKKHVVYSGALGNKQNPEGLISFFLYLVHRRSDVVCHVFSGGPIFEALRRRREMECSRLVFHDLVQDQDLFELYLRSHIQVIPETKGYSAGAVPSKLPNLMAAGVPILYIGEKNSDVWRVIQAYDAGVCADSWEPEVLSASVDRLLQESAGRSHADRRLVFQKTLADIFSIEALLKELIG